VIWTLAIMQKRLHHGVCVPLLLLLDGVTFLFFGAVLPGPTLEHVTRQKALYAALSLTVCGCCRWR
jgi:hypothetical protein